MAHRSHSAKHVLPDNPIFIDFPRSDGDARTWPTKTTEVVDADGEVNFMRPVPLDESLAVKWRMGVADAMALQFNYAHRDEHRHVLRDFPAGYRMFDHHKGKQAAPRHDVYLFGENSGRRYRSVPEFIPHAIWLMGDGSEACKCKYCTKKPQREITQSMSGILRSSPSPGPSPSRPSRPKPPASSASAPLPSRRAARDQREPTTSKVAIQDSLPDASPYIDQSAVMLIERNLDLRAVNKPNIPNNVIPRYFREGELVWAGLNAPIRGPNGLEISLWPGLIDSHDLLQRPMVQGGHPGPECHRYKVRLLGAGQTLAVLDDKVVPYQSYMVSPAVLNQMAVSYEQWDDLAIPTIEKFEPCSQPPPSWDETLSPYALALQTASNITEYWSVTDDWDAKVQLPAQDGVASSLTAAIERAGANNSLQHKASTQTRFQGLWWGGERIWVDDIVRLKLGRSMIAPEGTADVYKASGPGAGAASNIERHGWNADDFGSSTRATFMRIDSLFLLESKPREVRVAGMLYELADEDWEDPNLPRLPEGVPGRKPAAASKQQKPLPIAPKGNVFRPILKPGREVVLSLTLVAGRYYPRILYHPMLEPQVRATIGNLDLIRDLSHLWALEGLFPGVHNAVDPKKFKANREALIKEAYRHARKSIVDYVPGGEESAPMEVDQE
ncbi:Actin-related protein 8 [Mycena chlorophos]|uniref:Actin-related protein 8 n=1 Tax=Mycena chlorophos TaxID=658473 RepID=A0A8H6T1F4_MYCCL|nr:Actin-related protein 8 [Mycena chlorophos]